MGSQDEESRPSFVRSRDDGSTSSLRFGSFVGNMGELLDQAEEEDDDLSWDNAGDDENVDLEAISATGADVLKGEDEDIPLNTRDGGSDILVISAESSELIV